MADTGPTGQQPDQPDQGGWTQPPAPPTPPAGWSGQDGPPPAGPGGPGGYAVPYVNNNLVWAILSTIFCCLPAGVVSIVYAAQVEGKLRAGDHRGAVDSANKARTWAIVSAAVTLVLIVLGLAAILTGALVGLGGGMTDVGGY